MCGILGAFSRTAEGVDLSAFEAALAGLSHRGPDGMGVFLHGPEHRTLAWAMPSGVPLTLAALGHRRLSIIDLSDGGRQPMQSPDGRFTVVFNGEIYNYRELAAELGHRGRRMATSSDTEVALAALMEWGPEALARFDGMFALALYDAEARTLLVARDPFGIKPLYLTTTPEDLYFGSEPPAVLRLSNVRPTLAPQAVFDYLRFGVTDHTTGTLFRGIDQLGPGEWRRFDLRAWEWTGGARFWSPERGRNRTTSIQDAAEQLRALLEDSVRLHMRSDVPVGVAISGGLDSSILAMQMARSSERPAVLHGFGYLSSDPARSEEHYMSAVVRDAGVQFHPVRINAADVERDLERVIRAQGEPFTSASMYAQYRIFQEARAVGVPVVLNGQGADELFAGYRYFVGARLATLLRQGRWGMAGRLAGRLSREGGHSLRQLGMGTAQFLLPAGGRAVARRIVGLDLRPGWLRNSWCNDHQIVQRDFRAMKGPEYLMEDLRLSMTTAVLPHLLRYEDRNSMAHSIESRVPFLLPRICDLAYSLPEDFLVSAEGRNKAVLHRAATGLIPIEVLARRDKIGFETPQAGWLKARQGWVRDVLLAGARRMPLLDSTVLVRDMARVDRPQVAHGLWRAFCFALWAETYDVSA